MSLRQPIGVSKRYRRAPWLRSTANSAVRESLGVRRSTCPWPMVSPVGNGPPRPTDCARAFARQRGSASPSSAAAELLDRRVPAGGNEGGYLRDRIAAAGRG